MQVDHPVRLGERERSKHTAFTTVNTAAVAPIPSASVMIAASANDGDVISWRIANRTSCFR
jgi:hypothetical protein